MAQESTGSEQTCGAAAWIIVEKKEIRKKEDLGTNKDRCRNARRGSNFSGLVVHSLP
jgi:hypothetical protein